MTPLAIPWSRAVAVESRDGRRKLEAVRVDWIPPTPAGIVARFEGFLPNPPEGGEGGWISAAPGDYIVREGGHAWVVPSADFEREWIDPAAELARAEQRRAQAIVDAAAEEKREEDRKARELADAKRLLDEKRDREKRERDGSAG